MYAQNAAVVPQGAPGILEAELNGNANSLTMLANAVAELESKLVNVLRPEPPPAAPTPAPTGATLSQVAPPPSPLVMEAHKQRWTIDALTDQVGRLIQRLEV